MIVGVLDYGMGNIRSIYNAIEKLGFTPKILNGNLKGVDKLIIPGVGAFPDAMSSLRNSGTLNEINEFNACEKPILGICLGMQVLFESSEEISSTSGINLISGHVRKFPEHLKSPQIQWNRLKHINKSSIYEKISNDDFFYFLHSYYVESNHDFDKKSITNYNDFEFLSSFQKNNIFGCQFHPEKSSVQGLNLLNNFCNL